MRKCLWVLSVAAVMSLAVMPAQGVIVAGRETMQTVLDTARRARSGDEQAQYQLAWDYRSGVQGVLPKNMKRAVEWYAKAANNGFELARIELAQMYEFGEDVPQDHEKARSWILEGPRGDAEAAAFIARRYLWGDPEPSDLRKAIEWYRLASELPGQTQMLCPLGKVYERPGEVQSFEEASRLYRKAAELGEHCGMAALGRLYAVGKAVPQDSVAAAALFRAAGDAGSGDLARLYEEGIGVPRDLAKAVELYHVDACQNDESQRSLMNLFEKGHSVPINPREAFEWYQARARAGEPWGKLGLALHYEYGIGVSQDRMAAIALYTVVNVAPIQTQEHIPDFTLGDRCGLVAVLPGPKEDLRQFLSAIHKGTDLLTAISELVANEPQWISD